LVSLPTPVVVPFSSRSPPGAPESLHIVTVTAYAPVSFCLRTHLGLVYLVRCSVRCKVCIPIMGPIPPPLDYPAPAQVLVYCGLVVAAVLWHSTCEQLLRFRT
jgi:hypothetical protein